MPCPSGPGASAASHPHLTSHAPAGEEPGPSALPRPPLLTHQHVLGAAVSPGPSFSPRSSGGSPASGLWPVLQGEQGQAEAEAVSRRGLRLSPQEEESGPLSPKTKANTLRTHLDPGRGQVTAHGNPSPQQHLLLLSSQCWSKDQGSLKILSQPRLPQLDLCGAQSQVTPLTSCLSRWRPLEECSAQLAQLYLEALGLQPLQAASHPPKMLCVMDNFRDIHKHSMPSKALSVKVNTGAGQVLPSSWTNSGEVLQAMSRTPPASARPVEGAEDDVCEVHVSVNKAPRKAWQLLYQICREIISGQGDRRGLFSFNHLFSRIPAISRIAWDAF